MPVRREMPGHWVPSETRAELVHRSTTVRLAIGPYTILAGGVPLFRERDGRLHQAVRVFVEGPGDGGPVRVALTRDGQAIDAIEIAGESVGKSLHLFVDELEGPAAFALVATFGSSTAESQIDLGPERKWTVHLIHHSHFDYGYTDTQATVMEHQLRYLDAVLDLIAATEDWPEEAAFRWNVEVTYPLQQWLAARPRPLREEFFRRVREGRIEINALPFSMHSEVYSIDELAWGFDFPAEVQEQEQIEIVSAIQSDVPGCTLGLLNLLTSAGIKYLSVAHNYAGRSMPHTHGGQAITRPFWWQGEDGKRLLVWQSDTPHGVAYMDGVLVGVSENAGVVQEMLPNYLASLAANPYPYGRTAFGWHDLPAGEPVTKQPYPHDLLYLRVQNGFADNAPPTMALPETVREWNETWAFPRLHVSTNRRFFETAEQTLGDRLDTFSGDWTDWWVDGVGSGARPLGLNREAQTAVRTAQTLHTLAEVLGAEPLPGIEQEIGRVYENAALFDEHTWGSANPWQDRLEHFDSGQIEWGGKSAFGYQAYDRSQTVLNSGLHQIAATLGRQAEALTSIVVFNPSSWVRTDLARVFVPAERLPLEAAFRLVHAATGESVPVTVSPQPNPGFRAKGQWLTFVARDMPAVGYARFDLMASDDAVILARRDLDPAQMTIESPAFAVELNRADGFISSLRDLATGRDLVRGDAPYGFNEYIYDRYTTAAGFNHLSGRVEDLDLRLFGSRTTAHSAAVVARTASAIGQQITVRMHAEGCEALESTVSVYNDLRRVDIRNRLFKTPTPEKESVYFAFPFAVEDSDPAYEISGGITSASAPHVPGSVRHMFAIRHWVGLGDEHGSVGWATRQAPLIEPGTITLPYVPFPSTLPADAIHPATIYSWALNNIWDTNFPPAQGGEMLFDFAIGTDVAERRYEAGIDAGASVAAPFAGICLSGRGTDTAPAAGCFLQIDTPLVQAVTVRRSRTGEGVTAFIHSIATEPVEATVRFPDLAVERMRIGNHLERDFADVALTGSEAVIRLNPGAYVALQMTLKAS